MSSSEGDYIVKPYDLDVWQARAVNDRFTSTRRPAFQLIVPLDDELVRAGVVVGRIHLLRFREPFFSYGGGVQGESPSFKYKADGVNQYNYYGQTNQISEANWKSADRLPHRKNRFFMVGPFGNSYEPDAITGSNEYRIKNAGLEHYHNGEDFTEKIINWWRERYGKEFRDQSHVCVIYGNLM